MSPNLVASSADSETWELRESYRVSFVRLQWNDGCTAVEVLTSGHKGPWVGDGKTYAGFEEARQAMGLPPLSHTPPAARAVPRAGG